MRRALIVVALGCFATAAHASPGSDLEEARHDFRAKDCTSVKRTLSYLLYPEKLAAVDDLIDAHAMLGACYFDTGDRENARAQFDAVLQLQATKTLDSLIYSSGSVRLFDEAKADMEARVKRDAELHKVELEKARIEAIRKSLVVYEKKHYYINFVPFGAGQFQEDRNFRGTIFAITEGVLLGTSFGVWAYLVSRYGLVSTNVPLADGPGVLRLQQLEIVSGVGFILAYGIGIVDSLWHYKSRERELGSVDDSILQLDEPRPATKKPAKPVSLLDRVHIGPMIVPGGAGIGIGWEN